MHLLIFLLCFSLLVPPISGQEKSRSRERIAWEQQVRKCETYIAMARTAARTGLLRNELNQAMLRLEQKMKTKEKSLIEEGLQDLAALQGAMETDKFVLRPCTGHLQTQSFKLRRLGEITRAEFYNTLHNVVGEVEKVIKSKISLTTEQESVVERALQMFK